MNIKKILSLSFCFVLLVGAVFSFSSCKKEKVCEHTFDEAWSTDATNHWHAATCDHKEEKKDLAAHVDANADEKCDVCAYAMPAEKEEEEPGNNNPAVKPEDKPTEPETPAITAKTQVTYTVTVVNAAGEALAGAKVKLLDKEGLAHGDGIPAKDTNAEGKVTFTVLYKSGWLAQVVAAPEGYELEKTFDEEIKVDFVDQYEFDEEFNLTITLPVKVVEEDPTIPPVDPGVEDDVVEDDGTDGVE